MTGAEAAGLLLGPELPCLCLLSFGKRWAADFLLVGFVSLGFEHVSSMIVRISICGKLWPDPEGKCGFRKQEEGSRQGTAPGMGQLS